MYGSFRFNDHFCIVFEALSTTPVQCCVRHACRAARLRPVRAATAPPHAARLCALRKIAAQMLASLALLRDCCVIHADIKPENILLLDPEAASCRIKVGASRGLGG